MNRYSIDYFSHVAETKKLSELFLGYQTFDWRYSVVDYTADCTVGLDLTLFDKAVCGIVSLDGAVSPERLGEILGLNVVADADNGRYADSAEVELLSDAIASLVSFEMLETDIYTGKLRLTPLGREYYQQGRKFKTSENQAFTVFFDPMAGKHGPSKGVFEFVQGMTMPSMDVSMFHDEALLKSFISEQIPGIHDTEKGNSFTNIMVKGSHDIQFKAQFAVLYDVQEKSYRLVGFINDKEIAFLTDAVNGNPELKTQIVGKFLEFQKQLPETYEDSTDADIQEEFEQLASEVQGLYDFDRYNGEDPEKHVVRFQSERMLFEQECFWNDLPYFVGAGTRQVFFNFDELTPEIMRHLSTLSVDNPELYVFVLYRNSSLSFNDHSGNFFFYKAQGKASDVFCIAGECRYVFMDFTVPDRKDRAIVMVNREVDSEVNMNKLVGNFAQIFVPSLFEEAENVLGLDYNGTRNELDIIEHCGDSLDVFLEYIDADKMEDLRRRKMDVLNVVRKKYENSLLDEFSAIVKDVDVESITKIDIIGIWKGRVDSVLSMADASYVRLNETVNGFKNRLREREQQIRDELMSKLFVFDTNSLMLDPDIVKRIGRKDKIVIPLATYEELEKLKAKYAGQPDGEKARKARKNIDDLRAQNKGKKGGRVRIERADLSLLPEELLVVNRNNPDNYVLAIAYGNKKSNPYLITNDEGLLSKASAEEGLSAMKLDELDALIKMTDNRKTR